MAEPAEAGDRELDPFALPWVARALAVEGGFGVRLRFRTSSLRAAGGTKISKT